VVVATPHNRAGELAVAMYASVLAELSPEKTIARVCRRVGDDFYAGSLHYDLSAFENVYVCGAGKASAGLAHALLEIIGDRVTGGLVITKYGHGRDLGVVTVREAGHPVPDRASLSAGEAMLRFAESCTAKDLVLFVLSGGASALMEVPELDVDFLTLVDVTELMLANGASIHEINRVRSRLSRIKGGKLGLTFAPAQVCCLVLSDVAGDDLSVIGSAPLWGAEAAPPLLSDPALALLSNEARKRISEAGSVEIYRAPHVLLGGPGGLPSLIESAAKGQGISTYRSGDIRQEAKEEAESLVDIATRWSEGASPFCAFGVGEAVVKVIGKGKGGRCQEFACAAADAIRGRDDWAVLAGSTDGTDGPTDYAGGLVDGGSADRAAAKGVSVADTLNRNDSSAFLEACDGLIRTGPTQTNVTDIYLAVRA
jgi:glycerate 2-kinase